VIVRLRPDEPDRLRAIRLRALAEAPAAFGSTLEETRQRPPSSWRQQARDLPTWLAVVGGEDVGMVRVSRAGAIAWLISMWVAPGGRGKGLGDALVAAVVDWAKAAGCEEVRLEVSDDNAAAIRLYARHGFVPTGLRKMMPPPQAHRGEHEQALRLSSG